MTKETKNKTVLEVRNLTVSFGDVTVLDNLNFQIKRGEFVGLIGPNGAGKTTLIKVLLGLLSSTEGSVDFLSRNNVRYVPQQYVLPSHVPLSISEVIQMGSRKKLAKDDISCVLDEVGLDKAMQHKSFHALSGGQKQRVTIARALVVRPDIIFFDEPLSGVDLETKMQIYEFLKDLNSKGMTILFISHDVDHVIDACDRVLCLDRSFHRGCHPVAFANGKRDSRHTIEQNCLVEVESQNENKKVIHHHH